MADKIPRPISIWITQILLIIFIAVFSVGFFLMLDTGVKMLDSEKSALMKIVILSGFNLLMVFLLSIAFWGLVERKSYGRWISVVFLILFFLLRLFSIFNPRPKGPLKYIEYDNATQRAFGLMTENFLNILLLILMAFLIVTLLKSKKVEEFFNYRKREEPDLF